MRTGITFGTCFLFLLSVPTFAGDWSVGASVTPTFTIPHSSVDLPSPAGRLNYSIGLFGIFGVNPNVFLRASVQYTRRDVLIAEGIPDARSAMDPVTGRIDPSKIVYGSASERFESLTMPLTANIRFAEFGDAALAVSCGIEVGYLVNRSYIIEPTTTGRMVQVFSEDGFTVGAVVGITGLWHVSERLSLLVSPGYSYSWYPRVDFGSIQFHTIGVELGICLNY